MEDFIGKWLKERFTRNVAAHDERGFRMAIGLLEAWVSIIGNILMFGVKFAIGYSIGSISVIADAFHTLSDVMSSVVVLFGFKFSVKGPDEEHPYGHGRLESIATLVISILLVLTGLEFIKASIDKFLHPSPVGGGWWVVAIMIISAVIKEWMARFSFALGEDIDSSTLKADAWHHRSDAVASFLVAVGNVAAVRGLYWVDPVLGLAVAALIIYTAWELAHASGDVLIGISPPAGFVQEICDRAKSISGVEEVHKIQVHDYGYHKEVSLHVEVDDRLDLLTAHRVADEVEKMLGSFLQAEVIVHIDPRTKDE